MISSELAIDIETYSSRDLVKVGVYKYVESHDFEILIIGYQYAGDEDVTTIDLTDEDNYKNELARFEEGLFNPNVIKTAFNANFERTCLSKRYKRPMPPKEWRDTMILAVQLGLPRSLEGVGDVLLTEDKQKDERGKALIRYFSKPCKPTKANGQRERNRPMDSPEDWKAYLEYNRQDVVAEQGIRNQLLPRNANGIVHQATYVKYAPNQFEENLWDLDQMINDRGVLLDTDLAETIVTYNNESNERMKQEAIALTGLANPNSPASLKDWLSQKGIKRDTLTKTDIADLLNREDLPADVRRVLEIRKATGKASIKKFQTMIDVACADNRARGLMQFYGGHTGRWAGRLLQPQNLARNTMPDEQLDYARSLIKDHDLKRLEAEFADPSDVFSQLVRTGFIPKKDHYFVVSDFSAIEARVLAWVAGEDWRLNVFRNGGDIYCESASRIYHVPVVKHGVNGELRQRGKVAELALGYGGGVGAMKSMDTTGSVPESEMQQIVKQWRRESPNVVKFWSQVEKCALECCAPQGKENGRPFIKIPNCDARISFSTLKIGKDRILQIELPSGRKISFWGVEKGYSKRIPDTPCMTYMNQNQTTRKWERVETYGGKLCENIVQSIARDCLAEKMTALEKQGYHVVFHVHDEMIFEVPRSDVNAETTIDNEMGNDISWAVGLPLKGGTYSCDYYRKD